MQRIVLLALLAMTLLLTAPARPAHADGHSLLDICGELQERALLAAPDVAFVSKDRLPPGDVESGFLEMAPDLVVEVVSPGDSASYVHEKAAMWLMAGARLVWLVYPVSQSIVVHDSQGGAKVLHTGDNLDGAPVFEDFQVAVKEFFD